MQVSKLTDRFVDYFLPKNEFLNRTLKFKYGVDLEGNCALWYGLTPETQIKVPLQRAERENRKRVSATCPASLAVHSVCHVAP